MVQGLGDFTRFYSGGFFEDLQSNQPVPLPTLDKSSGLTKNTTNNAIVTAVSARSVRVVSLTAWIGGTAPTQVSFLDASGGTVIHSIWIPSNAAATPMIILPFNPAGWFRTAVGNGLYANVSNDSDARINVQYILPSIA